MSSVPHVVVKDDLVVIVFIPDFHSEFVNTAASVNLTVSYRNLNPNDLLLCISLLSQ